MIAQTIIIVCGILSIWLSQSPHLKSRRWAPIIGLAAQPAWLYATTEAEQWGVAALTLVYAAGWIRGIHTYWFKRDPQVTPS